MTHDTFFQLSKRSIDWIARALQLQLFLTLFSLPILVSWGIPFSCMSPMGNILFTPFLLLFLILASCIFFSQLLHIPHSLWTFLLNHLTECWMHVMNYGNTSWLIGVTDIPIPFLVSSALIPLFILTHRATKSLYRSTACFLLIFLSIIGYARYTQYQHYVLSVPCSTAEITILKTSSSTILVDPGCWTSKRSAANWTRYTLIPYLISKGVYHIDHVVLLRPKGFTVQAIEQLSSVLSVQHIHMPATFCKDYAASNKKREQLIQSLTKMEREVLYFSHTTSTTISQGSDHQVIICPTQTRSSFVCYAQIDNKKVTLYSS